MAQTRTGRRVALLAATFVTLSGTGMTLAADTGSRSGPAVGATGGASFSINRTGGSATSSPSAGAAGAATTGKGNLGGTPCTATATGGASFSTNGAASSSNGSATTGSGAPGC